MEVENAVSSLVQFMSDTRPSNKDMLVNDKRVFVLLTFFDIMSILSFGLQSGERDDIVDIKNSDGYLSLDDANNASNNSTIKDVDISFHDATESKKNVNGNINDLSSSTTSTATTQTASSLTLHWLLAMGCGEVAESVFGSLALIYPDAMLYRYGYILSGFLVHLPLQWSYSPSIESGIHGYYGMMILRTLTLLKALRWPDELKYVEESWIIYQFLPLSRYVNGWLMSMADSLNDTYEENRKRRIVLSVLLSSFIVLPFVRSAKYNIYHLLSILIARKAYELQS